MIGHLLNRRLTVWRPTTVPDGSGGQVVTLVEVGEVRAKVDQPTATEREQAGQWGAELTHTIRVLHGEDVRRGDELRDGPHAWRVLATVEPSHPVYLKAPAAELNQAEGDQT